MRKSRTRKHSHTRRGILCAVLVFLIAVGFVLIAIWEKNTEEFTGYKADGKAVEYNGIEYAPKSNIETLLVLGLDKFDGNSGVDSYNNDKQADFIMLLVIDNYSKKCTAIHVNRDTMAKINVLGVAGDKVDTVVKQIALAHTYGNGKVVSCRNTADSVSSVLMGVKINHYVSVTMDAVAMLNDLVGGVELVVLDDFGDDDPTLVQGQTVTLSGEQALNYVRARKGVGDSTNVARMRRQRQYVEALYAQLKQCVDSEDGFIARTAIKLSDYMVTDCSTAQLQALAEKFVDFDFEGVSTIEGKTIFSGGLMEFYPDIESVKQVVISMFYRPKN